MKLLRAALVGGVVLCAGGEAAAQTLAPPTAPGLVWYGKQSGLGLADVATIAESGYPGFEAVGWFGLMAPTAISRDVLARLNAESMRILNLPDVSARILSLGAEVKPSTIAEFESFSRDQIVKWAKVIKESGARID